MQIKRLEIRNYRTLESLDLKFPSFYTAICGRNDAGKTNVVRALRALMKEDDPYGYRSEQELSLKDDFPKWSDADPKTRQITISLSVVVAPDADAGLYQFLLTHLGLQQDTQPLTLNVSLTHTADEVEEGVSVSVNTKEYSGLPAQEVLKKLQTSNTVLFYNSTELDPRLRFAKGFSGFFRELAGEYSSELRAIKDTINKRLKRVAKGHQKQLTELLGRFEGQYRAALSVPAYDFDYLPFNLTLSAGKVDVALNDWGSGTRNRTLILLTLFRARQISQAGTSASKVTPILVIEEPESFLHPSAQAEFGRILQDLAEEFKVQVITTTHSPYLLSQERPDSNILLDRREYYHQLRETYAVDLTGENWMEPFGLALGISGEEFRPWRELFFSRADSILLVEGEIDKEYFNMLRDPKHGAGQLDFPGEIFAYCGKDTLKQCVLLKFIRDRYKRFFVTFDLDACAEVEKALQGLGLQLNKHYCPLGVDAPGRKDIEGLLPDEIKTTVRSGSAALVDQAMNGTSDERRSAKQELKRLYLREFKARATPHATYYGEFYKFTKLINRAMTTEC
jgi:energy-coupling factor transporter ATP-binding protein EcfA2